MIYDYSLFPITLQQIQIFLSVAQTCNFTHSAQQLNMTQPGISKSISSLEQILGFSLLQRTTKKVQLTEEGEILYEKWRNVLADLQNGYAEARHIKENRALLLNIGVTNTTDPDSYFWSIASRFQQRHPSVTLNVEYEDMKYLENGLTDHRYDIIFVPDFEHYSLDTCHIPWKYAAKANMQVILLNSHPFSQRSELTMEDIFTEPLAALSPETNPNFLRSLQELFGAYGREPQIKHFYKSNFQIRYAAAMQDTIHITDNFWAYSSNEYSRKIPLKDHYNGIICSWDADNSKKCLGEFLDSIELTEDRS